MTTETLTTETLTTLTTVPPAARERFYSLVPTLLRENPRAALVLADIGAGYIDAEDARDVAQRIINVGIREQQLISTTAGLALSGLRPIAHTFAPFLLERPFEQVKLDLGHQDLGAVLVSAGGSYEWPSGGETHMGRRDVAVLDAIGGWQVQVPGHADEAEQMLRTAVAGTGRVYIRLTGTSNQAAYDDGTGSITVLRRGRGASVLAVGPMADRVLAATQGLDVTVLYAATVRPLDVAGLRRSIDAPDVVVVEPYLAGTSVGVLNDALADVRHRVLGLGVGAADLHRYGTEAEHDRIHGLDIAGLRASISAFNGAI